MFLTDPKLRRRDLPGWIDAQTSISPPADRGAWRSYVYCSSKRLLRKYREYMLVANGMSCWITVRSKGRTHRNAVALMHFEQFVIFSNYARTTSVWVSRLFLWLTCRWYRAAKSRTPLTDRVHQIVNVSRWRMSFLSSGFWESRRSCGTIRSLAAQSVHGVATSFAKARKNGGGPIVIWCHDRFEYQHLLASILIRRCD